MIRVAQASWPARSARPAWIGARGRASLDWTGQEAYPTKLREGCVSVTQASGLLPVGAVRKAKPQRRAKPARSCEPRSCQRASL
jgi:hypothetical protein